jgi:chemotaxis protein MotB
MSDEPPHEIIIIKRRMDDGEDDHHGGAWKIAFADFMTAMMAFFLVMWIINSSSKETKALIVQYFNPVQLVDSNPIQKGLRDPASAGQGSSKTIPSPTDKKGEGNGKGQQQYEARETALHKEPMEVLEQIAQQEPPPDAVDPPAKPANPAAPSFNDPFDRSDKAMDAPVDRDNERPSAGANAAKPPATAMDAAPKSPRDAAPPPAKAKQTKAERAQAIADIEEKMRQAEEKAKIISQTAASLRSALEKVMKEEARGSKGLPQVEVVAGDDGALISLTDDANFSMFDIGSIEPKPQLVRILAKVGKILAEQRGDVEIRGHTDARSYKSRNYDNWRLSSDRATIVSYALMRGGLVDQRISRVSGYADHRLKNPKDPFAANNRRIEIFLRGDAP